MRILFICWAITIFVIITFVVVVIIVVVHRPSVSSSDSLRITTLSLIPRDRKLKIEMKKTNGRALYLEPLKLR